MMCTATRPLTFIAAMSFSTAAFAQISAPNYAGLQPGVATRAQVEAVLGPALGAATNDFVLYDAAKTDKEGAHVAVEYSSGATQIAQRIEVRLIAPRTALAVHQQFGLPMLSRRIGDSREEFFFPALQGAVFSADAAGVETTSTRLYVSPRYLAEAQADKASVALGAAKLDAAKGLIDAALIVDPSCTALQLVHARYLVAVGSADAAIAVFEQSQRWSPREQYEAQAWLGSLWGDVKKDQVKARAAYARAIATAPPAQAAEAHLLFGQFLVRNNAAADAVTEFRAAIASGPAVPDADHASASVDAHRALGDLLYGQGKYSDAIPHYEQLFRTLGAPLNREDEPRWFIAWRYAYALGTAGQFDRAIAVYWQLMSAGGVDAATLNNVASFHERAGRVTEAADAYRRSLSLGADLRAAIGLGRVQLASGRADLALKQAIAAVALDTKSSDAMILMARVSAALKDDDEAVAWLKSAAAAGFKDAAAIERDPLFAAIKTQKEFVAALAAMK